LGLPVVPEVKTMKAGVSGVASNGAGSGWGEAALTTLRGTPGASPSIAGSPRMISASSTSAGRDISRMCSSSLRPNCEFCKTGIAPIHTQARNAAANSTELVMRYRTLSPGLTPNW
jgi:hypothetical protein